MLNLKDIIDILGPVDDKQAQIKPLPNLAYPYALPTLYNTNIMENLI